MQFKKTLIDVLCMNFKKKVEIWKLRTKALHFKKKTYALRIGSFKTISKRAISKHSKN